MTSNTSIHSVITSTLIAEDQRLHTVEQLFSLHFPFTIEPAIYHFADLLAEEYTGGYWDFYTLSNDGFYMALETLPITVISPNGYTTTLDGESFGLAVCLFAYSNLSFSDREDLARVCTDQYHWLREYVLGHTNAEEVLRVCD